MGIDRIGKGGQVPVPEAGQPTKVGATFDVREGQPARAVEAASGAEATPLARLRAGQIDVDTYVDLKVEDATSRLTGLTDAELADIRKLLRDQMATDPALVELVRAAGGAAPSLPED